MSSDDAPGGLGIASLRRRYAAGTTGRADVLRAVHTRIAARGADGAWIHVVAEPDCLRQLAAARSR